MFKIIQEPYNIDIFNKYDSGSALTEAVPAGTIVMRSGDGTVAVSDGKGYYGVLSQTVYPAVDPKFNRPSSNFEAYDGDFVGIYTDKCVFSTDDQVEGTYKGGDAIYVTSAGKLTNKEGAPSATQGNIQIGEVIRVEGDAILVLFYGKSAVVTSDSDGD